MEAVAASGTGEGGGPPAGTFRQLALPFAHRPSFERADLLPIAGNHAALAWLEPGAHRAWPGRRLALSGAAGSGKTHLAHVWAAEHDAILLPGTALDAHHLPLAVLDARRPVAVDDADDVPDQRSLLHLLNAVQEHGLPLLLTAREPPARWIVERFARPLPDLSSRLRAIHAVPIGAPDPDTLRLLLCRLLVERQLAVPATVLDWLLLRLPREFAVIRDVARRLDEAAFASGRPVSRSLAAAVLSELPSGSVPDPGPSDDPFPPGNDPDGGRDLF